MKRTSTSIRNFLVTTALPLAKRYWGQLQDLLQPKPKEDLHPTVARALAGPPDDWRHPDHDPKRSWGEYAKEQAMRLVRELEPTPLREARKIMAKEQGIFKKLSALFSQLHFGLPRLDGEHIKPEAIGALPYEYTDPFLQETYHDLRRKYFPNRPDLDDYKVVWRDNPMPGHEGSGGLQRTLGYIVYQTRTIHIAREMSHEDAKQWIPALVHHELCHGALVPFLDRQKDPHGEEFQALNNLHPDTKSFDAWNGQSWRDCFENYHQRI